MHCLIEMPIEKLWAADKERGALTTNGAQIRSLLLFEEA